MTRAPRISVVVPLFNEEASAPHLIEAVREALVTGDEWELLLVDDGSRDRTVEVVRAEARKDPRIRLLRLARNYGQTAAMQAGFDHARGDVVVSMDGDLQNDPRDIPRLVRELERGYDLVAGYREHRKDRLLSRKLPSWVANRLIRWVTGVPIRDNGCSLKAYRRALLGRVRLYSEMHRFIPAVSAGMAGARITEVPVRHHARRYGESKYGLARTWRVLADLVTITMIRWFRQRPLALFGWAAAGSLLLSFFLGIGSVVAMMRFGSTKSVALVLPGAAFLFLGQAVYFLMLGLIGEEVVRVHAGETAATILGHQMGGGS